MLNKTKKAEFSKSHSQVITEKTRVNFPSTDSSTSSTKVKALFPYRQSKRPSHPRHEGLLEGRWVDGRGRGHGGLEGRGQVRLGRQGRRAHVCGIFHG